MDKKQIEAGFKTQLAEVLKDLSKNGAKDREVIWLIGSLAGSLITKTKANDWVELKASISPSGFNAMLNELQNQGQKLQKAGNIKAAYAVQAVGISLVSNTMKDKGTKEGAKLLDGLINQAVDFYEKEKGKIN